MPRALDAALNYLPRIGICLLNVRATPIDVNRIAPPMPAQIALRQLEREDIENAMEQPDLEISARFADEAQRRDYYGFGAFDGEQLVAYVWRSTSAAPFESGSTVRVNKPYSYLFKSLTLPEYRGQGIAPNLYLFADRMFLSIGYTHRCAYIQTGNSANLRAE